MCKVGGACIHEGRIPDVALKGNIFRMSRVVIENRFTCEDFI